MKTIRILLVGGGSGGHIYPLIAIAQKLNYFIGSTVNFKLDLRYFGDAGNYKDLMVANNIKYSHIVSSKLRRYFTLKNILDFLKFFAALFQSLFKVFAFMPDVVFSKGGPGSLPILFVCKLFAVPIVIHESDSVPGLSNLISAKISKKIFLSFDSAKKFFGGRDVQVVGNPVRSDLLINNSSVALPQEDEARNKAKKIFGFTSNKPVLLIIGGSLGAVIINDFVLKNIEALTDKFQILHQVGSNNFNEYKRDYEFLSKTLPESTRNAYNFFAYFGENLKDAYIASDLVLARAGAGTIFELAYFGKPSILVPLPESAGDHQALNSAEFEETGASVDIQQENFLSHLVLIQLESLVSNPEKMKLMSKAAFHFYKPFSAEIIATYLLSFGGLNIYPDSTIKEAILK